MLRAMPAPAAMRQLADLRDELGRIDRLRVKLLGDQVALTMSEAVLLIDRARDGVTAEIRAAKARLRAARAA